MRKLFSAFAIAFIIISGCSNENQPVSQTIKKEHMPDSAAGYVDVNGSHMYYEIHGSGAPLVLAAPPASQE